MSIETFSNHFVGKVSQRAIIAHDGAYLLTLDVGAEKWGVPGGRLHVGEIPLDGLKREVREELGININPIRIIYTEVERYSDGTPVLAVYYLAELADMSQPLTLDISEVAEAGWYRIEDITSSSMHLWSSTQEAIRLAATSKKG